MAESSESRFGELETYVVALMAAALHGREAGPKPEGVTWGQVYRLVARNSIQAMVVPALTDVEFADMPAELAARWRQDADMTLFQQVSYDIDREKILADFAEAGLSWIPLKGIIVATYYPKPGMRSMGDQDLVVAFVDEDGHGRYKGKGDTAEERRAWISKADGMQNVIMGRYGYKELSNQGREHAFAKAPLHFELHRSLVSAAELSNNHAYQAELDYYDNPWALASPVESVPGEFRFSREDEYIFHVDHMSKHYRASGFGLRFLADEYLYCMKFPETVRSESVRNLLKTLRLDYFEQAVRELSVTLFDHPDDWRERLNEDSASLFADVLSGGTYGSLEHAVARRLANDVSDETEEARLTLMPGSPRRCSLLRYVWERLFPPRAWVEAYHPKWSRNRLTRFLLLFRRAFGGLRMHPQHIWDELRLLWRRR